MSDITISLAQMSPIPGDLDANRETVIRFGRQAIEHRSHLIVFPELALTGYQLRERTPDLALRRDDPFWDPLLKLSRDIAILVGFVLEENDEYYNAAALLTEGRVAFIHRKTFLPNYGPFEEGKWFSPGKKWSCFEFGGFILGVLICEESWHLAPAYMYYLHRVDLLCILTNSCNFGRPTDDPTSSAFACKVQNAFYARMLNAYVCFTNRIGREGDLLFWGGSEVVDPLGNRLVQAPEFAEALITASVQRQILKQARYATPLRRDEKLELFFNHLKWYQEKEQ